ncbi:hypothetical protein ACIOWE_10705 [Pseudomonas sp. NPDC087598]|uniref:hypothetical protein n=1 Tax=Pseudomonas sp. NPDC087598 TaxID=3364440 RepID=UPI0037F1FD85
MDIPEKIDDAPHKTERDKSADDKDWKSKRDDPNLVMRLDLFLEVREQASRKKYDTYSEQ